MELKRLRDIGMRYLEPFSLELAKQRTGAVNHAENVRRVDEKLRN